MRKSNLLFFVCLCMLLGFSHCQDKKNKTPLVDVVARFIQQNDSITGYGSLNINHLAKKAVLDSVPIIGHSSAEFLAQAKEFVDLSENVYFAFSGHPKSLAQPPFTYLFITVKESDKVQSFFEEMGYQFTENNGVQLASDNTTAIGIGKGKAVFILGENNANGLLESKVKKAFQSFHSKQEDPLVKEIGKQQSDIVLALNPSALILKELAKKGGIDPQYFKRLPTFTQENTVLFSFDFQPGKFVSTIDLSHLQPSISNLLFLDTTDASSVLQHLGNQQAESVLAVSLNIKKLNHLVHLLSPDRSLSFFRHWGKTGAILEGLSDGDLHNLIAGKVGGMSPKNQPKNQRFYAQLGKEKQNIQDLLHTFAKADTLEEIQSSLFRHHASLIKIDSDGGFIYQRNVGPLNKIAKGTPQLPAEISNFGSTPFALFIDSKALKEQLHLDKKYSSLLKSLHYIYAKGNNKKMTLIFSFHHQNKNALQVIIDDYMKNIGQQGLDFNLKL